MWADTYAWRLYLLYIVPLVEDKLDMQVLCSCVVEVILSISKVCGLLEHIFLAYLPCRFYVGIVQLLTKMHSVALHKDPTIVREQNRMFVMLNMIYMNYFGMSLLIYTWIVDWFYICFNCF